MSTYTDNAALEAALGRTGATISTTATFPVIDTAGGAFILKGAFKVDTSSTESCRLEFTDGGSEYVRIDIEHDGTGTPTWSQDGTQTITNERLFLSDGGTVWNFALDVTLSAPAGGDWSFTIDPYVTASASGQGIEFTALSLEPKV